MGLSEQHAGSNGKKDTGRVFLLARLFGDRHMMCKRGGRGKGWKDGKNEGEGETDIRISGCFHRPAA